MLTIVTMASEMEPYASGAQRVKREANALGLPCTIYPISMEAVRDNDVTTRARIVERAIQEHDELLTVDADDELIAMPRPAPETCEVGLWRNPELALFQTHLQWGCGVYMRRGKRAAEFARIWRQFGQLTGTVDHRALHLAYICCFNVFAKPQWLCDVTAAVSGCISLSPSPRLGYRSRAVVVGEPTLC